MPSSGAVGAPEGGGPVSADRVGADVRPVLRAGLAVADRIVAELESLPGLYVTAGVYSRLVARVTVQATEGPPEQGYEPEHRRVAVVERVAEVLGTTTLVRDFDWRRFGFSLVADGDFDGVAVHAHTRITARAAQDRAFATYAPNLTGWCG